MKSKAALWGLGAGVIVITGAVAYFQLSPRSDAKFLTKLPPGVVFTPRSSFSAKPWFKIPWFGGKRLTFPNPPDLPKGFRQDPDLAGFLTWNTPPGAALGAAPGLVGAGPVAFSYSYWEDGGAFYETRLRALGATPPLAIGRIPFVYGDVPRRVVLTWVNVFDAVGDRYPTRKSIVELPPNHLPPPILPVERFNVGRYTVVLTPLPSLGPSFCPRYRMSVEGNPKPRVMLLQFGQPEYATVCNYVRWTPEQETIFVRRLSAQHVPVMVMTAAPAMVEAIAKPIPDITRSKSTFSHFQLCEDGHPLGISAYDSRGDISFMVSEETAPSLLPLEFEGFRTDIRERYGTQKPQLEWILAQMPIKRLKGHIKAGEKIKIKGLRVLSRKSTKFVFHDKWGE